MSGTKGDQLTVFLAMDLAGCLGQGYDNFLSVSTCDKKELEPEISRSDMSGIPRKLFMIFLPSLVAAYK
eukprot:1383772-Amorphochlora_amoeboformis.AAC.2